MAAQPAPWLWRGRNVKLVDERPFRCDTEKNQEAFPQSRGRSPTGLPAGPPARHCLAVLRGCWSGSAARARQEDWGDRAVVALMDKLCRATWSLPIVLCATSAFARLRQRGVDVLIRQHQSRHTDFRRGGACGSAHVVTWLVRSAKLDGLATYAHARMYRDAGSPCR